MKSTTRIILFVCLCELLLAQCGTLVGTQEIIAVDSRNRGVPVYADPEGKKLLGVTPVYVEDWRRYKKSFYYRDASGRMVKDQRNCDFRWWYSIIPDVLLAYYNPLVTVGFLATDAATGGLLECPEYWSLDTDVKPAEPSCRQFVILPPMHKDPAKSKQIAELFHKSATSKLQGCDKISLVGKEIAQVERIGFGNSRGLELSDAHSSRRNQIGLLTGASHVIDPKFEVMEDGSGVIRFTPEVVDLPKGAQDRTLSRNFSGVAVAPGVVRDFNKFSFRTFLVSSLPNSLHLKYYSTSAPVLDAGAQQDYGGRKENKPLPFYLSNFSFDRYLDPRWFEPYDFTWESYFSLGMHYFDYEYTAYEVRTPDPNDTFKYHLLQYHLIPFLNIGPTLFTPIGNVGAHVSIGPSYSSYRDNRDNSGTRYNIVTKYEFFYYAFVTENMFLTASLYQLRSRKDKALVETDYYSSHRIEGLTLGIAYYLPSLGRQLSSSW